MIDVHADSTSAQQENFSKFVVLFLVALGFLSTFAAGVYLGKIVPSGIDVATGSPIFSPTASSSPQSGALPTDFISENQHTELLPGKHFYRDTLTVITKDPPHYTLLVTVTRDETDKNFFQTTAASFFDGTDWTRVRDQRDNTDPRIEAASIVKSWDSLIDPSRVLKQKISAEVMIENTPITIETGTLENEISMRSLPGYTKFMSHGKAQMSIAGRDYESYVLLTRIYSLNVDNIQFYDEPIGLTTDWLAFWDANGDFYHVDATNVERPTPIYQTHQIGVVVSADKSTVQKTFAVGIERAPEKIPTDYRFVFPRSIGTTLDVRTTNSFVKEPESGFDWYAGNVVGEAKLKSGQVVSGVGFIEYIHDNN